MTTSCLPVAEEYYNISAVLVIKNNILINCGWIAGGRMEPNCLKPGTGYGDLIECIVLDYKLAFGVLLIGRNGY